MDWSWGGLGFLRTNPPAPLFSAHLPALSSPPAGNRHRNCTPDRVFQGVDLGTPVLSNSSGQSRSSHRVDPVAREGPRTARQQESLGHTSDTPLATWVTDSDQGKRPGSLQPLLRQGNMIHPKVRTHPEKESKSAVWKLREALRVTSS